MLDFIKENAVTIAAGTATAVVFGIIGYCANRNAQKVEERLAKEIVNAAMAVKADETKV